MADTHPPPPQPPRGFGSRLRDARIRSKLGLILLIPLLATVALAAARLADSVERAGQADTVASLATVSVEAATVGHQLHQERVAAVGLLAEPDGDAGGFGTQSARTDDAVDAYQAARSRVGDLPDAVTTRLVTLDAHIAELDTLRQQVLGEAPLAASAVVLRYGAVLSDLHAYQESAGGIVTDPSLSEQARAVAAWANAKAHAADAEAIAALAAAGGPTTPEQARAFLATQTGQQEAFATFGQVATPQQQQIADQAITGGSIDHTPGGVGAGDPDRDLAAAAGALAGTVDTARWVEQQLLDQLLAAATRARNTVFQQVAVESGAVLLVLAVAVTVAALLARMLARQLRRLRSNAIAVAEHDLPATVKRLSDPRTLGEYTPAQLAAQVREPIALGSRDEIGEVARAFNVVHRAAVQVAAEQAALRTSVSVMFLNLARRSQTLVDKMISQLDRLERPEQDPQKLADMFGLDNLATRMRRNDENLLILAGADSSPPRTRDALVADVLRAAQSEVEHYDRIEFGTVDPDVSVVAGAINDVVRLVAELLDNATRFSPPTSAVVCEARRLGDQMIVQVEDRGVGMTPDEVEAINTWLAQPSGLDVTTFRRMGVAVIAKLATRHQIRVQLQSHPHYGTTATLTLPPQVLVLPASRLRAFQPPAPRVPLPPGQPPAPVPARHLGQLPRRSATVVHHAASWRTTGGTREVPPVGVSRTDLPVAGRPAHGLTPGHTGPTRAGLLPEAGRETTIELPIFREMTAAWFRDHPGGQPIMPTDQQHAASGQLPPPEPQPARPTPITTHPGAEPTGTWRTAADEGWGAAAAAAQPNPGGSTVGGLPRRVPQAQLVPGSVETLRPATTPAARRTPDQVRGLLSAYHRGVQRGREAR